MIGRFRYPLRDPFSAVLVDVGGGRIQRPLHHTGLREPTRGRRERKEKVVMWPTLHRRALKSHTWPIPDGWTWSR